MRDELNGFMSVIASAQRKIFLVEIDVAADKVTPPSARDRGNAYASKI
jgi:hypothetical protein